MIYRSIEEMKEKNKDNRNDVRNAYNVSREKDNKKFRRIFFGVIFSLLFFIVFVKIFFGEILIPYGVTFNGSKLYKVYVNDFHITVGYESKHKTPIIPFSLFLQTSDFGSYFGSNYGSNDVEIYLGDKFVLDVQAYECFAKVKDVKKMKVKCSSDVRILEEVDGNYDLEIIKLDKKNVYKYSNNFKNDIGEYFDEKGRYVVYINDRNRRTHTQVYFYVDVV